MTDEEITQAANNLSRQLRFMLRHLATGHLAMPMVRWFQADKLGSRFSNPTKSLKTLQGLGLVQSWKGRRKYREPEGLLWAVTGDGIGVHYELTNRGLYETKRTEIRPYPTVS